jgi:hypothetical protein
MTDDIDRSIESDALREAEFSQARTMLVRLVGRTITAVRVEETRIALETDDGIATFFYGYMGEERPEA